MELPLKATSFKEWAEKLYDYANSSAVLEELVYWEKVEQSQVLPLPKDREIEENRQKDSNKLTLELSVLDTRKLLTEVNKAYNTEINDILLAALGLTLKSLWGLDRVAVNLEGHGREDVVEGVNVSRTVGWFTSLYPVLLDMKKSRDIPTVIKGTKEMLRHVPHKGIGHGILKYVTARRNRPSISFDLKPEISFNYLGRFDEDIDTDLFRIAEISSGNSVSPDSERQYVLSIVGMVVEDALRISIDSNKKEYDNSTMTTFVDIFKKTLREIIVHCTGKEETELTVSDLGSSDFDEQEVDSIFEELEDAFNN